MNRFEFFEINYHHRHGKRIRCLPPGVERGGGAISCGEEPWEVTHGSPHHHRHRCTLKEKPHLTQPHPAGSQSTSQMGLSILQNFFSNQN